MTRIYYLVFRQPSPGAAGGPVAIVCSVTLS
jgi:hypothetical protein